MNSQFPAMIRYSQFRALKQRGEALVQKSLTLVTLQAMQTQAREKMPKKHYKTLKKRNGGPGRTRTRNLAVMSGQL